MLSNISVIFFYMKLVQYNESLISIVDTYGQSALAPGHQ